MDSVGAAYYLPGINHKNMMPEAVLNNSSVDQIGDNINIRHQERPRISSFSHSISCSPISKSLREPMTLNSSNDKSIRFYQSNSIAGSIPISELVRMLEDEMHISRDDKLALNSALLDPERQDIVIITLRDIELSSNIRFAVRRLKMLIHQNPAGMPADGRSNFQLSISTSNLATPLNSISPPIAKSSSSAVRLFDSHQNHRYKLESFSPLCADAEGSTPYSVRSTEIRGGDYSKKRPGSCDEYAEEITSNGASDTVGVILTSVGDSPAYSDPNCSGMCSKISRRLIEYNGEEKNAQKRMRPAKFAVLVGSGSCNPLTRMHMRSFFLAKQHLERIVGFVVLGSILSPSHGVSVRERYRNHPAEVIPSPHRLAVAQLMVAGSKWLSVDPWEITRRRTMDYMSLLQHCRAILTEQFPDEEIKIIYLCKENMVPKISPAAMRQQNFGCISVCRC